MTIFAYKKVECLWEILLYSMRDIVNVGVIFPQAVYLQHHDDPAAAGGFVDWTHRQMVGSAKINQL